MNEVSFGIPVSLFASIDWHGFFFVLFAAIACVAALMVVLSDNVVRMALHLVLSLGATAGLFFLAGAEFVGAMQLMIYVGGTLVLLVFGVMLTAQTQLVSLRTPAGFLRPPIQARLLTLFGLRQFACGHRRASRQCRAGCGAAPSRHHMHPLDRRSTDTHRRPVRTIAKFASKRAIPPYVDFCMPAYRYTGIPVYRKCQFCFLLPQI